jgi:hypothetical protein
MTQIMKGLSKRKGSNRNRKLKLGVENDARKRALEELGHEGPITAEVEARIVAMLKAWDAQADAHPVFRMRSAFSRAVKATETLMKGKIRQVEGKPWTWAFHELPDAKKVEPGRQIIRRALFKTAFRNLRSKYGGMDRKSLRSLAEALAKKTFRDLSKDELLEMYRKAEGLGRVI